jgi:hypothetical protein
MEGSRHEDLRRQLKERDAEVNALRRQLEQSEKENDRLRRENEQLRQELPVGSPTPQPIPGSARNGANGRAARPGKASLRSAAPRMQRAASRQWKCR